MCASQAPSGPAVRPRPSRCPDRAASHPGTCRAAGRSPRLGGQPRPGRRGRHAAGPGAGGGERAAGERRWCHGHRAVPQRRHERPRYGPQPTVRYDDDRAVAQSAGAADPEQRGLQGAAPVRQQPLVAGSRRPVREAGRSTKRFSWTSWWGSPPTGYRRRYPRPPPRSRAGPRRRRRSRPAWSRRARRSAHTGRTPWFSARGCRRVRGCLRVRPRLGTCGCGPGPRPGAAAAHAAGRGGGRRSSRRTGEALVLEEGFKLRRELPVVPGRRARHGQRRRPPALAPQQQPPRVGAPERIALGQRGQFGAVGRAVGAQLGGPEGHLVLGEGIKPARTGGGGGPGIASRVGLQGSGQPGHAAGQQRPATAWPGGALEMLACFGHAPSAQREAADQQVRVHGLAIPGRLEAGGDPLGVPEERCGPLTGRVPGLGEDEVGARFPDSPLLRPEQPTRLTCSVCRIHRVARGQGRRRRRTAAPLSCTLSIPPEVSGSARCRFLAPPLRPARRQQRPAAVNGKVGVDLAERVVAATCSSR